MFHEKKNQKSVLCAYGVGKRQNFDNSVTKLFPSAAASCQSEIDSDKIDSLIDLILNASTSSAADYEYLTAMKKRLLLSDLSSKEEKKAATDFTLLEAIETFGLKYVESLGKFQNHEWDIENDVGKEEFPTTPCISETLTMPILLNHILVKRD